MPYSGPSRRAFARGAALWAGATLAALSRPGRVLAAPVFLNDPFQLGVASGDPVPDGFVIWTRLAPDPLDLMALPPEAIAVTWEVATDAKMLKVAVRGQAIAHPELAHSIHVDVRGLEHGREYFYRFRCGQAVSRIGRATTLPTARLPLERLRFAVASCQHYEQGYFSLYRDMIAQKPDFILHLGDYVYEVSWGTTVRHVPVGDAKTLDEYRLIHAVYKTDPDLQAAHAYCPWLLMWDDHEVSNDYSAHEAERDRDPALFDKRKRAAYQAYYEHMPLRPMAAPQAETGGMILFQRLNFGDLMEIAITDQRQYRDPIACQTAEGHAGRVVDVSQCEALNDPRRSMLGAAQEQWLNKSWAKSDARWNVIAQTLMLTGFDQLPGPGRGVFTDNWGGYPAAKRRLFDLIKARRKTGANNFISLGGDIHSFFISDVKDDDANPASDVVMSEFVGTSITSESYNTALFAALMPENPHIKLSDDRTRGYLLCDVTHKSWQTTLRVVDNVRTREARFSTLASFVVESGRTGLQNA